MKGWHKAAPRALLTAHYPHLSSCVHHIGIAALTSFQSITIILFSVANGLASKWKFDDHSQIVGILLSIGIIDGTDYQALPPLRPMKGFVCILNRCSMCPLEPPSAPYFLLAQSQQIMQHRQWPTRCETKGIIDKM